MASSLVVHGAVFAVGALVGGGIAATITRKSETTSSQIITRSQQPVAPLLQVETAGNAVLTHNVGIVPPPLKYGSPGEQSPPLYEGRFPTLLTRANYRPTRPQGICGWLRSSVEAPGLGTSCGPCPQKRF